jgi:probable F420-dependent oxidoreductase
MTSNRRQVGLATACTKDTVSPPELGQWAEANGFDSIWFGEHSHIPANLESKRRNYKNVPESFKEMYDPLLALMAVASVTKDLKLGTSVSIVTEHHPISFATRIATLDHLSGGRFILGAGAGWSAEEMADYGVAFADRWKYVRECVLAMREIWGNEIAEFKGELLGFPAMWCGPKPVKGARLPVLIGASGKYAFARIEEYGDGWIPVDQNDNMAAIMDELRAYMAAKERSFEVLDHTVITHPLADFEGDPTRHFGGDPDRLKRRIEDLHAMGFNRVLLQLPADRAEVQWKELEQLGKVAQSFA